MLRSCQKFRSAFAQRRVASCWLVNATNETTASANIHQGSARKNIAGVSERRGGLRFQHRLYASSAPSLYKVAIVGTGPSGFYTAKYLLSALDKLGEECTIDLIERLPTPYGLVRYGVAPDHPEVKNVENDFAALFQKYEGRLNFYGNVAVGSQEGVSLDFLRRAYDGVVLAYGCESDRKLGLPGENSLKGILSAREFVAWYNGHPHFEHIGKKVLEALSANVGEKATEVVVIGVGNVALDCARILAKGANGLHDTDIASRALPIIGKDGVSLVTVVARRGHVQGAFTIKELRELSKLEAEGHGAKFVVRHEELELGANPASVEELGLPGNRPKVRIDNLLRDAVSEVTAGEFTESDGRKEVRLRFLMSPKGFEPSESDPSSVGAVVCERTKLEGNAGEQVAVETGQIETFPAQLVLVSIGYKGVAVEGTEEWFDDRRGIIRNEHGKVDGSSSTQGGLYVSGWLKRGPSGIIGTNIGDAKDTVATLVQDLTTSTTPDSRSRNDVTDLAKHLEEKSAPVVHWTNFEKIDAVETSVDRKRSAVQPREKLTTIEGLLEAAFS